MKENKLMLGNKELKVGDILTEKDGFQYGKIRFINREFQSVEMVDDKKFLAWNLSKEEGNLGKLRFEGTSIQLGMMTIEEVINYAENTRDNEKERDNEDGVDMMREAIILLKESIKNKEQRQAIANEYIGEEPYCWCVLPNFTELDEEGATEVPIQYPDGEVIIVPLEY